MPRPNNSPTPDTQIRMESLSNEEKHFIEESLSIDKMRPVSYTHLTLPTIEP